jgi:hypothetical protein
MSISHARVQFSGCSSTTNAHGETGQMAVCCQNLPLGALSSHSAPSLLVGELFKKLGIFLNTGVHILLGRNIYFKSTVFLICIYSKLNTCCRKTTASLKYA